MGLDKNKRTVLNALNALQADPKVSTWDMTEKWKGNQEVWSFINELKEDGLIFEVKAEYPWHKFKINDHNQ